MRHSIRIAPKFLLLIVVLVPSMVGIAWIGLQGLSAMGHKLDRIYGDNLNVAQKTAQLGRDVSHAGELTLQSIIITAPAEQGRIDAELIDEANPAVEDDIATLERLDADDRVAARYLRDLVSHWHAFLLLERSGRFEYSGTNVQRVNEQTAASARPLFAAMEQDTAALIGKEVRDAAASKASASSTQSHYRGLMIWISVAALAAVLALVIWLIRDVVPRVTAYSAFARRVADDGLVGRIEARGSDELTGLATALNRMVERAESNQALDARQREFSAAMQVTESEEEAQELLRRQLQRVVPESDPVVFVRNNSEDRLQAASSVAHDPELAARLTNAKPRSCLAVRYAQSQQQGSELDPLLECEVCGKRAGYSLCDPLIVHGEVIGSVLLTGPRPVDETVKRRLSESIAQASPVLGNLRNLAIAELRAATDALTGLPNNRAAQDNLRRMVAHASRSVSPLAAVLLDLDHFKRINDLYGHPKADEVLALVGATLSTSVRESDFVARYGGEEFLVLMPGTEVEGAVALAEKIREAISALVFPDLEQPVTASLGIAVFPDDASDPGTLIRHADRALYTAKRAGRNRVERFAAGVAVPAS